MSRTIPASDPRIHYLGRVALDEGGARFGYPGITVRLVYRGLAPTFRFRATTPHCYFNVSCNGWEPVLIRLAEGYSEFPLPSGAAPESGWTVELVRRTEAWQGIATFEGLTIAEGTELLECPALPGRRLLVIGDSVTGGEFVERMLPENLAEPRTANASRSFGMLLARACSAQVHLVSYGGRGVMRDWRGLTDGAQAPAFFERTMPDEPASRWDHSRYVPDAVVIALGTNDCGAGLPDADAFVSAYARLVARVREVYPRAAILVAESPIFGGGPSSDGVRKRDFLRGALEQVVAISRDKSDTRVRLASVGWFPGTPADAHPVAFQHEQIAEQLLGPLRQLTGW